MKKMICAILALMLVLTGCQTAAGETTPPTQTTPAAAEVTQPQETTVPTQPQETTVPKLPEFGFATDPVIGPQTGEPLPFAYAGKTRLQYNGDRNFVLYVTSVEQLPKEGDWKGYDEKYFETKALLIVVDTLGSGSVQVELESVTVDEGIATVTLKRTLAGEAGTADMATWMLWAEVEKGLDYTWVLKDADQSLPNVKY